jgi:hypothetical protein
MLRPYVGNMDKGVSVFVDESEAFAVWLIRNVLRAGTNPAHTM